MAANVAASVFASISCRVAKGVPEIVEHKADAGILADRIVCVIELDDVIPGWVLAREKPLRAESQRLTLSHG